MKQRPELVIGYTSAKVGEHGKRFAIRLCRFPNGGYTIALGMAKKTEGSDDPSEFVKYKYTHLPVWVLDDLKMYVPPFVDKAKVKLKEAAAEAAAEKARKAAEDPDADDASDDNQSQGGDDTDG